MQVEQPTVLSCRKSTFVSNLEQIFNFQANIQEDLCCIYPAAFNVDLSTWNCTSCCFSQLTTVCLTCKKHESIDIQVYLPDAPPLLAISQCG
jgi:hypothetical protein